MFQSIFPFPMELWSLVAWSAPCRKYLCGKGLRHREKSLLNKASFLLQINSLKTLKLLYLSSFYTFLNGIINLSCPFHFLTLPRKEEMLGSLRK